MMMNCCQNAPSELAASSFNSVLLQLLWLVAGTAAAVVLHCAVSVPAVYGKTPTFGWPGQALHRLHCICCM
jgi:hypothetical protein